MSYDKLLMTWFTTNYIACPVAYGPIYIGLINRCAGYIYSNLHLDHPRMIPLLHPNRLQGYLVCRSISAYVQYLGVKEGKDTKQHPGGEEREAAKNQNESTRIQ